jgi:Fe-S-cluster containining protein
VKGYVYLSESDVPRIAAFLQLSPAEFEARYVYRTKHLLRLRKPRGKECSFLQTGRCSIHPVNPVQCRTFPFWPEMVESRDVWEETGRNCPGIGQGQLVQIGEAMERADLMRRAYPGIYDQGKTLTHG